MIDALRSGLRGPRTIALAVLACALALRLLVPAGWMPVADAAGVHLTLCSGSGPMVMPGGHAMAGEAHHGKGDPGPASPEHSCAFAPLGLAIAAPILPAIAPLLPVAIAAVIGRDAIGATIGHGLAAPPPPPTGPPTVA